ncbi:hypothetical protein U9M48_039117 [Paspalum notatum var. saurae]|uniref:Uncharacterized protein n=1 Tax=Paspalum notatum var. saurae TaxID=547442 RepID=A0AAQ3UI90_PASNO
MFDTRSSGATAMNIQAPASSEKAAVHNAQQQETDGAKTGFKISAGSSSTAGASLKAKPSLFVPRVEKEGEGAMPTLIDMDTQPEEDGNKEYERQDEDKENGENNAKKENEHEAKGQQTTTVANGSGVVGTSAAASQNSKHVFALNYTGLNGTEAWRATSLVVDQPVPPVKLGTKSGIPSSEFVADAYMTPTRKSKRSSIQGDHWLRLWAQLQRTNDKKEEVVEACKSLEFSAMELFSSFGWPFVFRIGF